MAFLIRPCGVEELDGVSAEQRNQDAPGQLGTAGRLDHLGTERPWSSAQFCWSGSTVSDVISWTHHPERGKQEVDQIHGTRVLNVVLQLRLQVRADGQTVLQDQNQNQ